MNSVLQRAVRRSTHNHTFRIYSPYRIHTHTLTVMHTMHPQLTSPLYIHCTLPLHLHTHTVTLYTPTGHTLYTPTVHTHCALPLYTHTQLHTHYTPTVYTHTNTLCTPTVHTHTVHPLQTHTLYVLQSTHDTHYIPHMNTMATYVTC